MKEALDPEAVPETSESIELTDEELRDAVGGLGLSKTTIKLGGKKPKETPEA